MEAGFETAACKVWVVQLKEAGDVSSGKAAATGRIEVMRKRIARQEVRLAWGHDCAATLGSDSAGPVSHSVGAEMQTESHLVPAVGAFGVPPEEQLQIRFAPGSWALGIQLNTCPSAKLGVRFA